MKITSLKDLLTMELQDLYSAEKQILEAAPKMADAATSATLKKAIKKHITETETQAERLEEIATFMDIDPDGKSCEGMKGIIKEGEEILKMDFDSSLKDAAIISASQRVEHYEIAVYGTAIEMAEFLQLDDVADLLRETITEEKNCDELLTKIATDTVNKEAMESI